MRHFCVFLLFLHWRPQPRLNSLCFWSKLWQSELKTNGDQCRININIYIMDKWTHRQRADYHIVWFCDIESVLYNPWVFACSIRERGKEDFPTIFQFNFLPLIVFYLNLCFCKCRRIMSKKHRFNASFPMSLADDFF